MGGQPIASIVLELRYGNFSMPTPKQLRANRRNALKSTGPRTPQGKETSSQNAIKHGLCAERVVILGEDPEDFERLREGLIHQYTPVGFLERDCVERIVSLIWRLRRIPIFESGMFKHLIAREEHDEHLEMFANIFKAREDGDFWEETEEYDDPDSETAAYLLDEGALDGHITGEHFLKVMLPMASRLNSDAAIVGKHAKALFESPDILGKLARYDTSLSRSLERTIRLLHGLQDQRRKVDAAEANYIEVTPQEIVEEETSDQLH